MEQADARYLVGFENLDGTRDTVTVWARSPEAATQAARAWLEESQEIDLSTSEASAMQVGEHREHGDLEGASASEDVQHERFGSDGKRLSTMLRADAGHIRRLTQRMRTDPSPDWSLLRQLLKDQSLDPRRAVVVALQPDDELPQQGISVVCEGRRVFSFFPAAHPLMEDGLPVLRADASFEIVPGPALIELPSLEPWTPLIRAGFRILEDWRWSGDQEDDNHM